jgi:ribonuclease HI
LVCTVLRALTNTSDTICYETTKQRLNDNKYLSEVRTRNFNKPTVKGAAHKLPKQSDSLLTKYTKVMHNYGMITVSRQLDNTLIVDNIPQSNRNFWIKCATAGHGMMDDIIANDRLLPKHKLQEMGINITTTEYDKAKAVLHDKTTKTLKDHINKIIDNTEETFPYKPANNYTSQFHWNTNSQSTFAFTDGSAKDGKAGWGAFFKKGSSYNASGRTMQHDTIGEAELEAIEYVLSVAPNTMKLTIFADSQYAIDATSNCLNWTDHEWSRSKNKDVLYRIKSLIQLRGGYHRLKLEHVYSHQQEKIASCGKGTKISSKKHPFKQQSPHKKVW